MPPWPAVIDAVAEAWSERKERVREQGAQVLRSLGGASRLPAAEEPITEAVLTQALDGLQRAHDPVNGGFGRAPKFPQASLVEFLLARGERDISLATLRAMAAGGIYDQIGGGFARYAVDATWTVPHFEKMLYDNALLARAYLHGWQVSHEPRLRRVCEETLDWALREMRGAEGGFCSALDADSEGVEGKFYVWTLDELHAVLDGPGLFEEAVAFFGATAAGNFEGANVLEARGPVPARLTEIQAALLERRADRVRPGLDDKRLTSWNALMVSALAQAGAALERSDYVAAAVQCAEFLLRDMRDADGRLLRTWKDGRGHIDAYLEDHAYLLEGLLTLYEATFDPRWFAEAHALADTMIERFADTEHGGFFTTAADHREGFARQKDLDDSPTPSGGASAAFGLLRLARLTGEFEYERHALDVLRVRAPIVGEHPHGFGHALQALDFYLASVREVAIVGAGDGSDDAGVAMLAQVVRGRYAPHVVLAGGDGDDVPLLEGRTAVDGRAAAYVCEHFACQAPVTEPDALAAAL
jgi:hypothetical protein